MSFNEVAVVYAFKHLYDEAIIYCHKAIDLSRKLSNHTFAVHIRSLAGANLSLSLLNLAKADEALVTGEATLLEREGLLGVNDKDSFV